MKSDPSETPMVAKMIWQPASFLQISFNFRVFPLRFHFSNHIPDTM